MIPRLAAVGAAVLGLLLPLVVAQGGGTVNNVGPVVRSFTSLAAQPGVATRLYGIVSDGNGEPDLVTLRLHTTASPEAAQWANRTLVPADRSVASEPTTAVAGWRVWDPAAADGRLSFSFEWTPALSGTYTWALDVFDESLQATASLAVASFVPSPPAPGPQPTATPTSAPTSTASSSSSASPSPSTTSISVAGLESLLQRHGHDLSWSLVAITDDDGVVHLTWTEAPGALGYQVWRSTSPFVLRGEVAAGHSTFSEDLPGGHAIYKVTYFTSRDPAGGWASDGAAAAAISGWDATLAGDAAGLYTPPARPMPIDAWSAFVAGFALAVVAILLVAARRPRGL